MADNTFRCLFEQDDGSFCMEVVGVAGHYCAHHTRVVEVPVRPVVPDEIRCIATLKNGQRCSHPCKGQTTRCGKHRDWTPIVQCAAVKHSGQRCTVNALPGRTMCGTHKTQEPGGVPEPAVPVPAPVVPAGVPVCHVIISSGARRGQECGRHGNLLEIAAGIGAQPEHCCAHHIFARKRKLRRQWRDVDIISVRAVHAHVAIPGGDRVVDAEIVNAIRRAMDWHVPMTVYSTDPTQAYAESMRRAREALLIWATETLGARAAAAPRTDLERFTRDAQNVHTPEANAVVANANVLVEGTEAISGSLAQIKARFAERDFGTPVIRKNVHKDMSRWYSEPLVMRAVGQMENNDFGYQRLLDKVWGLIQKSTHKDDLEVRLWEEAVDSLGMCTQGHMTRLANVLQGFDVLEAPKVEIPKGERLQTAMAQIAELPQNERESAARRVFAELEVAEGEQGAWMEALEVA